MEFQIKSQINSYRKQFISLYKETEPLWTEIFKSAHIFVDEGVDYDNGGHGHNLIFYIEETLFSKLESLENISKLTEQINDIFKKLTAPLSREYIKNCYISVIDDANPNCQIAIKPNPQMKIAYDCSFWEANKIKLFISHKVEHKKAISQLAEELSAHGISSFVAHKDIHPTAKWQNEIVTALRTMDIFLAYLTDNFQEGAWTSQEIGFAVAKGVPIIPVKVGKLDPYGFIGEIQALQADLNSSINIKNIAELIFEKLPGHRIIHKVRIDRFVNSKSFDDAGYNFQQLQKIDNFSDEELDILATAFNENGQIKGCGIVHGKVWHWEKSSNQESLFDFLQSKSNGNFQQESSHSDITRVSNDHNSDDAIPF